MNEPPRRCSCGCLQTAHKNPFSWGGDPPLTHECTSCPCAKYAMDAPPSPAQCECGAPWVSIGEWSVTCVGFYSPPGHNHDDNCVKRDLLCANGHAATISLRRTCPACDWKGQDQCFCHPFRKVDAWPLPVPAGDDDGWR